MFHHTEASSEVIIFNYSTLLNLYLYNKKKQIHNVISIYSKHSEKQQKGYHPISTTS